MKKNYPISGTFIDEITYDIPSSNWSRKQWAKDLDHMKAVGIDTVIFIRGGFYNKAILKNYISFIKSYLQRFIGTKKYSENSNNFIYIVIISELY